VQGTLVIHRQEVDELAEVSRHLPADEQQRGSEDGGISFDHGLELRLQGDAAWLQLDRLPGIDPPQPDLQRHNNLPTWATLQSCHHRVR
jgi:hypothetical protein